jgi:hypothetical protein
MNHLREMIQDDLSKQNFDAPSLERVLRGRVCYKESPSSKASSHSQRKRKKRKHSKSHDLEEFKKYKPSTFDGEIKKGEEVEVWLLGLKKYFKVYDYSENLKVRIAIFNLNRKASI